MRGRLGIIGGLGASAGVALAQRVVQQAQAKGAVKDDDFPDFMLYNLPAHAMDAMGITDHSAVRSELMYAMGILTSCGCSVGVIACNTVQMFHVELQQMFPATQLVNPVVCACEKAIGLSRVGVMCSRTSKRLELFDLELARRNVQAVNTTEVEQTCLDKVIAAVICGKQYSHHSEWIENIAGLLTGRGAEKIILGCTELPLALKPLSCYDMIDAGACAIDKALTML